MIGELSVLSEWIPEQMEPGTIFVLENARRESARRTIPIWAVLSCPVLRTTGSGHPQADRGTVAGHLRIQHCWPSSSSATSRSCRASRTSFHKIGFGRHVSSKLLKGMASAVPFCFLVGICTSPLYKVATTSDVWHLRLKFLPPCSQRQRTVKRCTVFCCWRWESDL